MAEKKQPFRPHVRLDRAQWTVLGILVLTDALEFVFSSYWHPWINDHLCTSHVDANGKAKKPVYIDNQGFIVVGFLLFGILAILMLTGVAPKGGYAIAGLLLLSVGLARITPITRWIDVTTAELSGKAVGREGQS